MATCHMAMVHPPAAFISLGSLPFFSRKQPAAAPSPAQRLTKSLGSLHRGPGEWTACAAHPSDLAAEIAAQQATADHSLSGRWKKDKGASDGMEEACELVALPWVLRKALFLLNTLDVEDSPTHFKTVIKAGGLMDVVERYPWSGEVVQHARRDKRRGRHSAHVTRAAEGPCIVCTWEDPHGGDCTDTFVLSPDGSTLTQVTRMSIRSTGRSTQYSTVYRRVHKG